MAADGLFSRDEVQGGLPARRAQALLYLIECRAAHQAARSAQAMARFRSEASERERDLAFLDAYRLGRDLPRKPAIQDLEQFAPHWAYLVPDNPRLRAALAHLLGQKYSFTAAAVPGLHAALGLDQPTVQQAYLRLYAQPLQTIYAPALPPLQRLRFGWTALARWLETRPPFWTAFALTLTETVGATTLALPIAAASFGPLPTIALLVLFGLLNMLTIAALAESFARCGSVRYGSAYFGRLVSEYLGPEAAIIVSISVAGLCFIFLLAAYLGFSTTMAAMLPLPAPVWMAVLLLIGLYYISRDTLSSTVASALVVGAINLIIILIISLLALTQLNPEYLFWANVPLVSGRPFEPGALELILGVILAAYFGHTSIGNCAQIVLRRDPSARSLVRGAATAQLVGILFYSVWVFAVSGAVAPSVLAGQTGTALVPLAAQFGPLVKTLGSIYIVLGLGMASIHVAHGLAKLAAERLPRARPLAACGGSGGDQARGPRWRLFLVISPVLVSFLLAEWLLLGGVTSFSWLLSLIGAIPASLLAGVFPVLLLLALRRRGDIALPSAPRWMEQPLLIWGVYLLFLANPLLHSLVIWNGPVERAVGLGMVLAVGWATLLMLRRKAFTPRAVVELRGESGPAQTALSVLVGGQQAGSRVRATTRDGAQLDQLTGQALPPLAALAELALQVPAEGANALKVWAHQVGPDGESEPQPARIEVREAHAAQHLELTEASDQVVAPLAGASCEVRISLPDPPSDEPFSTEPAAGRPGRQPAAPGGHDRL